MAELEKEAIQSQPVLSLPGLWRYEQPPAPSSLYDYGTQGQVLAALLLRPGLLRESFGDLTITDFGGSLHQSLFRTLLKLEEDGVEFDITAVAEAWSGSDKTVGDALAFLSDLLNIHNVEFPVSHIRRRVDKLHNLSHLRRLRFFGEAVQRKAENGAADPHALIEQLEIGLNHIRAGYDLNGELLPYAPRNLARRPDLVPLSSIEAKLVPWLWEPYLCYGGINMLSGEPGCGKTFLALAFAASLTVGRIPFVGQPCRPHDVIYLSIENDPEYCLRPRFDKLEGDASRLHILNGAIIGEGPKARREGVRLSDVPLLESALKQSKAKFLVVDPLQSFLGGEVDLHRSNETRPVLDGLMLLARKYDVCLLILRHFAKSTSGSPINRGLGSIDLTGATRTELQAGKHNDQNVMVHAKSNIGPFGKSIGYEISQGQFRWTGECSVTAHDLAGGSGMAEEERDAVNDAADCLSDILKCGPRPAAEIFAQTKDMGFSQSTIRRAKVKLGVKSRKTAGEKYGHFEWYLEGCEESPIAAS